MTYDEWLAKYVRQVEVSAIPSMHGRDVHTTHYVFHVSGLGDPIFDSTWNHVHGAGPLTPAQVLDALCHDMVAVSVPFSSGSTALTATLTLAVPTTTCANGETGCATCWGVKRSLHSWSVTLDSTASWGA
jgi:hypothetical protein